MKVEGRKAMAITASVFVAALSRFATSSKAAVIRLSRWAIKLYAYKYIE